MLDSLFFETFRVQQIQFTQLSKFVIFSLYEELLSDSFKHVTMDKCDFR